MAFEFLFCHQLLQIISVFQGHVFKHTQETEGANSATYVVSVSEYYQLFQIRARLLNVLVLLPISVFCLEQATSGPQEIHP